MLFVLKTTYFIMRRGLASTRQTRRHSPTCFARTRQTRWHSSTCFAWTRQTRQHLPKAILEKNVTCPDTFARVMSESREFGASGHCLIIIRFNKIDNFIWINLYRVFPLINFRLLLNCIYLLLILEKLIDRFPIKNDNPFFCSLGVQVIIVIYRSNKSIIISFGFSSVSNNSLNGNRFDLTNVFQCP